MKSGSSGDDEWGIRRVHHRSPLPAELSDGEFRPRIDNIDHVMSDTSPLDDARFSRADIHAPVDLHRVDRQDFGVDSLCNLDGHLGLPRRRRAENRQHWSQTGLPTR